MSEDNSERVLSEVERKVSSLSFPTSLKKFLGSCENLTHENKVRMLLQWSQYLFQLQRDPALEDEAEKKGKLSLANIGIKKNDVKGACDMSAVISRLADIYCFVLTEGTENEYSDKLRVENLVCQDKYIALDIMKKMSDGEIDTVEGVLRHPFHWSDSKKILFICQTFDYIKAELESSKVVGSKIYDTRNNDQQSGEIKECMTKRDFFVKKYDVGEKFEVVPRGWVSKLMLDKHDCLTIEKRIKESRRRNDRVPDNDIIYSLIFNKTQKKNDPSYKEDDILELLRFLRNRHAHYWEFDNQVQLALGSRDSGYWKFFSRKFPMLFMYVYDNVVPKMPMFQLHPEPMEGSDAFYDVQPASISLDEKIPENINQGEEQERETELKGGSVQGYYPKLPANWEVVDKLGRGSFGIVYRVRNLESRKEYALKTFLVFGSIIPSETLKALQNEIKLLKKLNHRHIVKFHDSYEYADTLLFFMEYMSGRSLKDRLDRHGALSEELACKYTGQIMEGLKYLHSTNIYHRDLKGANILLNESDNLKLADFGIAKEVLLIKSTKHTSCVGTTHWMSPEVVSGDPYGRGADIWSAAITVYEMLTTNPPFIELNKTQAIFRIGQPVFERELPSNVIVSRDCHDFLKAIFVENDKRPYAEEILEYAWLKKQK